ncbi:hypothetical protein [uncultured Tenacibaculum sp.]|uniref:hypothetical protein n=1 Tax=uncultured Tenacibaculum sp. TaxID=174713 RepID=UPI002617CA78|nr:hypothetical protein [uncultured Tenacibaculum sp.]
MKKIYMLLLVLLTACSSVKKEEASKLPLLTVTKIENGKDGYTATLEDKKGGLYTCTISIPNLEDNYVRVEIGEKVRIEGEYAESYPVQIFAKRIFKVE